jgi:hypothetical protein
MIAATLSVAFIAFAVWPRERITLSNFGKIRVGMSQPELRHFLGTPEYEVVEPGLVQGPETFSTNDLLSEKQRRTRGFQEYRRQQWSSSELFIVVISDLQGRAVCRYKRRPWKTDWMTFLRRWLPR